MEELPAPTEQPKPGRFLTDLVVRLVNDQAHEGRGEWELVEPLVYQAFNGVEYVVPPGFTTDFASVPRLPIGHAIAGCRGHRAAVLHDYLCRTAIVPRKEADDLFWEALIATGTPGWIAAIMHLAVRSYSESLEND